MGTNNSDSDLNIICLFGLFPPQIRSDIERNSNGVIQYAADALQWSFIRGLDLVSDIKIVNLPFVGSYPFRFKRLKPYSFSFEHIKGAKDINVGFVNLPVIKMLSRYRSAKKALFNVLSQVKGQTVIIIYSLHSPFLAAAVDAKNTNPEIKICIIVPDIPEYMSENRSICYRILKRIDRAVISKTLEDVDYYVLLSEYMAERLKIKSKPYVIIEGIYNSLDLPANERVQKEKHKTIFYSGVLAQRYGIMNLMDAFELIRDPDYRLWICGDGDCRPEIIRRMQQDKRITYFGQISRSKVLELQKKATVLVNPRTSAGEFTKYSFPSKIMEYMASGTPCIMHRLKGIPSEYFYYCIVCEREDVEGLRQSILDSCEMSCVQREYIGNKASQFMRQQKNPGVQIKKICKMLGLKEPDSGNWTRE
jgi:glycosyltransferase involved in cell wall biosynthesis